MDKDITFTDSLQQEKLMQNVIKRRPRNRQMLPEEPIKLSRPKPLQPAPPPASWIMAVPTIGMAMMTGLITYSTTNKMPLTILPMFAMGFMTLGIQMWVARGQRKKVEADNERSTQNFNKKIEELEKDLQKSAQIQVRILQQERPSVAELVARVRKRSSLLWERQPDHDDFLDVRIGKGTQPLSRPIQQWLDPDDDDPRLENANNKIQSLISVDGIPITANLNKLGTIGVRGQRQNDSLYLAYTILLNVAVLQSPDEVQIYVISHRAEAIEQWGWTRWLPHTQALHGDTGTPHLSFSPSTDESVLLPLAEELRRRLDKVRQSRRSTIAGPHLVIVVDQAQALQGHPVVNMVLEQKPDEMEQRLAASILFVDSYPPQVNGMIEVRDKQVSFRETWMPSASQVRYEGEAELTPAKTAEEIARNMAPLRTLESFAASGAGLPNSVRLVEILNARRVDDIGLAQFYETRYDRRKVMSFPIGINVDGKLQYVTLRETGQKGNGQHAILAGGTGKGKSITLQSVVLSLALTHSPRYLNFILADFKGGASELKKLEKLPHVVGFVTDLKPSYVERFRLALEGEILRRKSIFDQTQDKFGQQITGIYDYNDLCLQKGLPYLPHLVLVIDEFHKARELNENFQKTMDNGIAAQGRALGMHLLLSTQKAEDFGSVLPNIEVKMSMGMNRPEDSKAIFKRDEAYTLLKRPGQAYLQALRNEMEVFEMFQVARSDTDYVADEEEVISTKDSFVVARVGKDGRRQIIFEQDKKDKEAEAQKAATKKAVPTEAEKMVEHILQYSMEKQYPQMQPVCLDPLPLPEAMLLGNLLQRARKFRYWQGEAWSLHDNNADQRLCVPLGMIDVPEQQLQIDYQLDLNEGDGNLLLIGPQGVGKSVLLRTLLLGLMLTHTPEDLHIYILARGPELTVFENFPHCGSVIRSTTETERLGRSLNFLLSEIQARREMLTKERVDNMAQLRKKRPDLGAPAIIVVVEDIGRIREEYEDKQSDLLKLTAEARSADIHIVVVNNSMQGIHARLLDNFGNRIALRLKTMAEYADVLNKRAEVVDELPGRGYVVYENVPREFQVAAPALVPISSVNAEDVTEAIRQLGQQMNEQWNGLRPLPIHSLPDFIELQELWQTIPCVPITYANLRTAPMGQDYDTLQSVCMDLLLMEPVTLTIGPKGSGKTEWVMTFCLAAAQKHSPDEIEIVLVCLDPQSPLRALRELPHVHYIGRKESLRFVDEFKLAARSRHDEQTKRQEERPQEITTHVLMNPDIEKHTVVIVVGWSQVIKTDSAFNTHLKGFWDNDLCRVVLVDQTANFSQVFQDYTIKNEIQRYGSHILFASDEPTFNLLGSNLRVSNSMKRTHGDKIGKGRAFFSYNNEVKVVQFASLQGGVGDPKTYYDRAKEMIGYICGQYEPTVVVSDEQPQV